MSIDLRTGRPFDQPLDSVVVEIPTGDGRILHVAGVAAIAMPEHVLASIAERTAQAVEDKRKASDVQRDTSLHARLHKYITRLRSVEHAHIKFEYAHIKDLIKDLEMILNEQD